MTDFQDDFQIELDKFKEDKQLSSWCEILFTSNDKEIINYTLSVIKSHYSLIGKELIEEYKWSLFYPPMFWANEKTDEHGWNQGKYQRVKEVILPYLKKYVTYDNF